MPVGFVLFIVVVVLLGVVGVVLVVVTDRRQHAVGPDANRRVKENNRRPNRAEAGKSETSMKSQTAKSDKTKQQERIGTPRSLEEVSPTLLKALETLPVSDESEVRSDVEQVMLAWREGGRTIEGTLVEMVDRLVECCTNDVAAFGFDFQLTLHSLASHGPLTAARLAFRCGSGGHNVWRYGPQQFIAVLHRPF